MSKRRKLSTFLVLLLCSSAVLSLSPDEARKKSLESEDDDDDDVHPSTMSTSSSPPPAPRRNSPSPSKFQYHVDGDDVVGDPQRHRHQDKGPYPPLTEEERLDAFERMWGDPVNDVDDDESITTTTKGSNKWSKEDDRDTEMTDTERVVEAIKRRFSNPDIIQVIEPPNLAGQDPFGEAFSGGGGGAVEGGQGQGHGVRKFKLVLKEHSITPAEPITNLLNKRKEPEVPVDEDSPDIITIDNMSSEESQANIMYKQAMELLGQSASRDSTGYHVITSVGKTEKVEQAYILLQQAAYRGHKKAMEIVAWGQLLGPLPLDIEGARVKFEALAKKGYPNSQMAMGFLHANALEAELSGSLPILHYTFSSIAGASWSQMALGYRFWGGIGVQVSCEKALEQYRRVAATVASEVSEVGTGPAIQRVRLLDEVEGNGVASAASSGGGNILNSDILDYYTMLAERGDLQAQVGLGQLHFQGGRGISPDHHLALRYFRRAADAGSPIAMAYLGKMYLEGNDAVESDPAKALKWFQKAAHEGSPVGQSGLGLMYLTGKGLPKDPSKALQYFTMAAEQGWVDGQLHLGNMYMTGIGVRRDYVQAAKYYNLAAQSGHILAIYNLAQMHATGTGMMRSCSAAVELYKTVAERGRWGLLLSEAHNDYKEKRYSHSLVKYLLLAELGYEAAQANAGFMLERGEVGWEAFESWKKLTALANKSTEESSEEKPEQPSSETIKPEEGDVPSLSPPSGELPTEEKPKEDVVESVKAGEEGNKGPSENEVPDEKPSENPKKAYVVDDSQPKYDLTSPQSLLSRALQQWARSAAQGYSQARVRLGDYYYYGWGTRTDYSSAATQYRLASEQQRNPQAMFNLAYMHEQGLGLKQDLHLAKRFYDMAAETSSDAKVPVTLALIKLNFLSTLQALNLFDFGGSSSDPSSSSGGVSSPPVIPPPPPPNTQAGTPSPQPPPLPGELPEFFTSFKDILDFPQNWDLYLLTVLVGVLGILVFRARRPPLQPQQPGPPPGAGRPPQEQQGVGG